MSSRRLAIGLMSATALSFAFSGSASAEVEAKAVVDALIAQFAKQGLTITAGASELDGDNVVVKDLSISFPEAEAFKIGQVVLEEVSEEEGGGYVIGTISAPETTIEEGDNVIEFGGASINGYVLPSPTETDPIKALGLYESIEIGEVSVAYKDEDVFRMDGTTASMSEYVKGQPFTFEASVDGLWGDLSKVEDAQAKSTIEAFGYKEVTGDVKMKGSWNPTDGRMVISEGAYNINNVGRLNVTMDILGYTPELVKGLQEMNKTMAGQDESAKGLAMLGLLQQLNFVGMTMRFDDASITNKVIDYAAKQAGQDRTAIINQTKGVLPFALAQLQDPDFAAKVTAAANAFIDNPRNLEIKAIPLAPVPFAVLAATGSTTPQALIKQLNVTVTANQ